MHLLVLPRERSLLFAGGFFFSAIAGVFEETGSLKKAYSICEQMWGSKTVLHIMMKKPAEVKQILSGIFFFFVRPWYQKTEAALLEPVRPYSDNLVGTKAIVA